jgi:hypothetical protein
MGNDSQKCHIRDVSSTAKKSQDLASTKEYINEVLSIAMHAIRAAIHSTLAISPGRHILNTPLIFDWHTITQRQEHLMNENHIR